MKNSTVLIKIILLFFLINMFCFFSYQSQAASLTTSLGNSVSLKKGESTSFTVTYLNQGNVKKPALKCINDKKTFYKDEKKYNRKLYLYNKREI